MHDRSSAPFLRISERFKPAVFLITILVFGSCGNHMDKDGRPVELSKLVGHLNTSVERISNAADPDAVYDRELSSVNLLLADRMHHKVQRWPGILVDIKEHPEYFSFAVLIPLRDDPLTDLRLRSLVLPAIVLKADPLGIEMLSAFRNDERVFISGAMNTDEASRALSHSYSSYVDNLFVNPVIEVSAPLLEKRE